MAKNRSRKKQGKAPNKKRPEYEQSEPVPQPPTGEATTENNGQPAQAAEPADETVSGYFRRLFTENPRWLDATSNAEIVQRWLADHPGTSEMPRNIRNTLANLKSVLRSKLRNKPKRTQRTPQQASDTAGQQGPRRSAASSRLEVLEEQIDDCLILARNTDREGLESIIKLLRRARNEVVRKLGQ